MRKENKKMKFLIFVIMILIFSYNLFADNNDYITLETNNKKIYKINLEPINIKFKLKNLTGDTYSYYYILNVDKTLKSKLNNKTQRLECKFKVRGFYIQLETLLPFAKSEFTVNLKDYFNFTEVGNYEIPVNIRIDLEKKTNFEELSEDVLDTSFIKIIKFKLIKVSESDEKKFILNMINKFIKAERSKKFNIMYKFISIDETLFKKYFNELIENGTISEKDKNEIRDITNGEVYLNKHYFSILKEK